MALKCEDCEGTGVVDCPECGTTDAAECTWCDGTGVVDEEDDEEE